MLAAMSPQIATNTRVDRAGLLEFARPRHRAILLTTRALTDGPGPWVQIDGDAEVLDMPEALEPLVEYYRSISGEDPDWTEYRDAMRRQASR